MLLSVVALVAAALCSGTAAVLQASAVGRSSADHVVGFLGGLARDPRYLGGLVLVAAGFLASLVAVQQLPLFLVQAGRAASLGVTAVLAAALLGSRLALREVVALGVLAVGLVAVAIAAAPSQITAVPRPVHWTVLLAAVVLFLAVLVVGRTAGGHRAAAVLGVLAGSCFGVVSLAARIVEPTGVGAVLGDPVTWAVGVAGLAGLAGGALALQRGGVVVVTAAMVATESVLGAVLGLAIGDRTVPGLGWLAVLGFAVTVGGALLLARFGAPTLAGDPADLDRD